MELLPTAIVRPGEADRIVGGHPWIYQGALFRLTQPAEDGSLIQVKDHRKRLLGIGFYHSKSKIAVRLLTQERVEVDAAFFESRIRAALALRRKHMPQASSLRVVNAESDFLSGLIVDKYGDILVMQITSLGMEKRKSMLVDVLKKVFSPKAILERADMASRRLEGLSSEGGLLFGKLDSECVIQLNGIDFGVDFTGGHKTGLYLDQQVNYLRVAEMARGANVLDCFSFVGGFAIHAAKAGAVKVLGLDQSADAVEAARKNAAANGVSERTAFEAVNVFDWLKAHASAGPHEKVVPQFDLIILDPPSFTRTRSAIPEALRGYKEIHLRALKLLKPGGSLATFCCSHHVDASLFQQVILDAAFDARRMLRRAALYTQSPDHPVIPAIPESEYLKGFAFEVC
jgi:23S rRNA (cytosine1962-C5)-methyltransferase